jgi:putative transposase
MCLQFVFLLITRVTMWLRLSQRDEACKTAEILILRHQLAVLQRRQLRLWVPVTVSAVSELCFLPPD